MFISYRILSAQLRQAPTPLLQAIGAWSSQLNPSNPNRTKNPPRNHRRLRPPLLRLRLLHDLNTNLLPSLSPHPTPPPLLRASQPSMFRSGPPSLAPSSSRSVVQRRYSTCRLNPEALILHTGLRSRDSVLLHLEATRTSTMVELLLMEVRIHGEQSQVTMPLLHPTKGTSPLTRKKPTSLIHLPAWHPSAVGLLLLIR